MLGLRVLVVALAFSLAHQVRETLVQFLLQLEVHPKGKPAGFRLQ
jgi:hypothetical protein